MITNFVEKYLKSDAAIDKEIAIFQETKQRETEQEQYKATN